MAVRSLAASLLRMFLLAMARLLLMSHIPSVRAWSSIGRRRLPMARLPTAPSGPSPSVMAPHDELRLRRLASSMTSTSSTDAAVPLEEEDARTIEIKVPAKFVPFPFQYRQEVELTIESITNQGWGVARVPLTAGTTTHGGSNATTEASTEETRPWVVMVPNVLPGEHVRARVFRNYPSYSEADLLGVVGSPSRDRVTPPCPVAGECGGCQYQHVSIERQRRLKTEHTLEAFQQYDLLLDASVDDGPTGSILHPCRGTPETLGYRSKLTPHYDAPRKGAPPAVGFQRQTSRQVVDVASCLIATPPVDRRYQEARRELFEKVQVEAQIQPKPEPANQKSKKRRRQPTGATLLFRQGNLEDHHVSTNHSEIIRTTVHGVHFDYQAGNFFQNNNYMLPVMVDVVMEQATKALAATPKSGAERPPTHMIDCYCGSGLFAISCAALARPAFQRVIGIEINAKAVAEATNNARINGLAVPEQVAFVAATAETIFEPVSQANDDASSSQATSASFPPDETVVVIDPPRKGCSPQFLELLVQFRPARVVYVSCNVVTQARDAVQLVAAGYTCTYLQPLDLFPQTRHVESVATFERLN